MAVIDAVTIRHRETPSGGRYSREQAVDEARAFLQGRPYLTADEARRTLTAYRHW